METKYNAKGQILSTELVLTFGIFMSALLIFLYVWGVVSYDYAQSQADREMQVVVLGISDALVLTSGDPVDWEVSTPETFYSLGLAAAPNILSTAKLSALQSLNASYSTLHVSMGAGSFDTFVSAKLTNGTTLCQFGIPGDELAQNVSSVTETRMVALDDGSLARLSVQVWRIKG